MRLLSSFGVFQYLPRLNEFVRKSRFRRLNGYTNQGNTHFTRASRNRRSSYRAVTFSQPLPGSEPHGIRENRCNLRGVPRGRIGQGLVHIMAVFRLKLLAECCPAAIIQFFEVRFVLGVDDPDSLLLFHNQIRYEAR